MKRNYRYLVPNAVTLLSLACGMASIMAATGGELVLAGALILASYILDLLDGLLARALGASSDFGRQLDSLADMVSLGAAPAILAFVYLQSYALPAAWIWPPVIIYGLSGAYRLARFNLLPPKTGHSDSLGLTISTSGAILTTAVLCNTAAGSPYIPVLAFFPLMLGLSFLKVTLVRFPSFKFIFGRWRLICVYLVLLGVLLLWLRLSPVHALLVFGFGYIGFGLARAAFRVTR